MTDPALQFVTAPAVDADVRFDCHLDDGPDGHHRWTSRDEFTWTPGAFLGDPDGIGGDCGLGQVNFTLYVKGDRAEARQAFSALSREMQRDENYLLFQLDDTSPPMWLRLYRASAGSLTFPYIHPDYPENDVWVMPVSLPTEARAMGERESFTLAIANDPALDDGLAVVLPEIKGDAPAPLVVEIEADAPTGATGYSLLSTLAIDAEWPGSVVPCAVMWQAESATMQTDASVVSSGSASGGSQVSISFALAAGWTSRFYLTVTPPFAGRYQVWARVTATGCDASIRGGAAFAEPVTTAVSDGDVRLVNLGVISLPSRNMPPTRGYTLGADTVDVEARRDSGSGSLKVDYLLPLPVDLPVDQLALPRTLRWDDDEGAPFTSLTRVIDGEHGYIGLLDGGALYSHDSGGVGRPLGGFPQAVPGATNVLHFLPRESNGGAWVDDITATKDLTISYAPRYVWLPSD